MKLTSPLVAVTNDVAALAVGVVDMSVVIAAADDIKCENDSTRRSKGGDIFTKNFILKCFGRWQHVNERDRRTLSVYVRYVVFETTGRLHTSKAIVQPFN